MKYVAKFYTDASKVVAEPGDIGVCATGGFVGRCIRIVTHSWANHAFVVVDVVDGVPIVSQETPRKGDVFSPITELGITKVAIFSIDMDPQQRVALLDFANWSHWKKYGFLALFGDLFNAATHTQFAFGIKTHMDCSTATVRAAERTDYIPSKAPEAMTPGDMTIDFGCQKWPD